jgi:hypothetical protein
MGIISRCRDGNKAVGLVESEARLEASPVDRLDRSSRYRKRSNFEAGFDCVR